MPISISNEVVQDLAKEMAEVVDYAMGEAGDTFWDMLSQGRNEVVELVLEKYRVRYPGMKAWMLQAIFDKRNLWAVVPTPGGGAVTLTNKEMVSAKQQYGE